jgi:hypothetical protein
MTVPTVIWVLHDSADESMFLHEVEWYREEFYLRLYSRKVAEAEFFYGKLCRRNTESKYR